MAPTRTVSERAGRLRELAESAENLVNLAAVLDETLAQARLDLIALAVSARNLAGRIEREAKVDQGPL